MNVAASLRRACALAALLALASCGGGSATTAASTTATASKAHVLVRAPVSVVQAVVQEHGGRVVGQVPGTSYVEVELPEGTTSHEYLQDLVGDDRVGDAEDDLRLGLPEGGASTIPAGTSELASMVPLQPELLRLGLEAAQRRATGVGVRVAVVDTGIDAGQAFFDGVVDGDGWDVLDHDADPSEEANGIDDDGDGLVDEGYGHGTFVASLIHAVAPAAHLVAIRVLDSDGVGTTSSLASGIALAADRGVNVICVAIGMREQSRAVQAAVQYARNRGAVVIASAGNTGAEDVTYPSAYSAAFGVTSVGPTDVRSDFASYGSEVDLCAPGEDLLGVHPGFATGTAHWSGTSFSSALVSGAFALVHQRFPALAPAQVLVRLQTTSQDVRPMNPGLDGLLGRGRLDLDAATAP